MSLGHHHESHLPTPPPLPPSPLHALLCEIPSGFPACRKCVIFLSNIRADSLDQSHQQPHLPAQPAAPGSRRQRQTHGEGAPGCSRGAQIVLRARRHSDREASGTWVLPTSCEWGNRGPGRARPRSPFVGTCIRKASEEKWNVQWKRSLLLGQETDGQGGTDWLRRADFLGLALGARGARSKERCRKFPGGVNTAPRLVPAGRETRMPSGRSRAPGGPSRHAHWFQPCCHWPCHTGKFQTPHGILKLCYKPDHGFNLPNPTEFLWVVS